MSGRYSLSPTLHLPIADSCFRQILLVSFFACQIATLVFAGYKGYSLLGLFLTPFSLAYLWIFWRQPYVGSCLRWRKGLWTLQSGEDELAVTVNTDSVALPWVIYLSLDTLPRGGHCYLWLFSDAVEPDAMRRLRVRLRLLREE